MDNRVSFRLDAETARILRILARQGETTKTAVIKEALREAWKSVPSKPVIPRPTAWEVYSKLLPQIPPPRPGRRHNRARNASRLLKEILLAKRRAGTL